MKRSVLNISDEDIARYGCDGAALLKGVIGTDTLKTIESGIEEIYRSPGHHSKFTGTTRLGETLVAEYVSRHSDALRAVLFNNGIVGKIAATMMHTPSAQLVLDQVFYKAKGPIVPTPWHQDTPFLRVRGEELIRVWIPCDYSPRALTVQVVRGSHRWNVVYNTSGEHKNPTSVVEGEAGGGYEGVGNPSLPPIPDIVRYRESFEILSWDVEPGDALVFQGNVLHGADGHPGADTPRRAFAAMMGGPNLRFHVPKGKAFPIPGQHKGEPIVDGAPIGAYEDAFPICWRAVT